MPSVAYQGDGVDQISDLSDDLLLHILRFLPDSRDVVCTSVLSTRWRSLWTRAPVLRIGNWKRRGRRANLDDPRFNDFVHNVLTRRANGGAEADIDTLELCVYPWPGKWRAKVWFGLAMQLTVKSLAFQVSNPQFMMSTDLGPRHSLPNSTRVTTLSLDLEYGTLLLPPAVQFLALTELTLSTISFSDEDGPRLGHLLSSPSCCPRLRKLTLSNLPGLHDLRLDGLALETLHLGSLEDMRRLEVDAPRLSALSVDSYFMFCRFRGDSSITVQAPALEKLDATLALGYMQLELQRHTIQLLQQCRPIHGHVLRLQVPEMLTEQAEDEVTIEIPQLPGVTDLILQFCSNNTHYLGKIVSILLARCSNLQYLQLDYRINPYRPLCEEGCSDCGLRGSWKDDKISLEHLREVKLRDFSRKEYCCLDMVQLLLTSAPVLERMIVASNSSVETKWGQIVMHAESIESSLPRGKGTWKSHQATDDVAVTYEWTPNLKMLVANGA